MAATRFFENLLQDLKYAARMLLRTPGFAITAILALALGIGANTAIFTVVNKVLLEPLSFPDPGRIVLLGGHTPNGNFYAASVPRFNVWNQQTQVFDAVAAYNQGGPGINLTGGDRPEQLHGVTASAGYFPVFGVPMQMGRPFTAEEDRPGGPKLAVISYGLWRSHFGSDPAIVGKTIDLGGDPYSVSGVTGPSFHPDYPVDIILPFQADPNTTDQSFYFQAAAHLKPGATMAMANTALQLAGQQFLKKFPGAMGPNESFVAVSMQQVMVSGARLSLLVLLGAVSFVLLIACANVANLLLVRATIRRREIAIRASLGAGRRRIISQLLTESVLLSLVGGALGLFIGYAGVRALLSINPGDIPLIGQHGADVTLDWRVLVFTVLIALVTGVLFGLIPALTASRSDLNVTLRESGARSGSGLRQNKARSLLVITEMALALILLVGATLLIRTFAALRSVDPGFNTHNVLTMNMSITGPRFQKTAAVAQLVEEARRQVEAIPGVEAMSTTCCLPLQGGLGLPFTIEGRAPTQGPYSGGGAYDIVSPEYFTVFRIPLLRGRMFTIHDDGGAPGVVLISETMAQRYWPKGGALGARITIGKGVGPEFAEPARQIMGVVGDARNGGLNSNPPPIMYIPVAQVPDGVTALNSRIAPLQFAIRTRIPPFSLSEEIQKALRDASSGLPVGNVESMDQIDAESTASTNFNMTLLTIFAGLALALAAIGIYGLMAYSVQQRTQEIGIRIALGASPRNVGRMIVRQGMTLVLVGVVIGVAAALALSRYMATLIYGVKTWDPTTFISVVVVLTAVALAATYFPARRASRVDPMIALRYE